MGDEYNKELCDKLMDTTEKRLDAHAEAIGELRKAQTETWGKIDTLIHVIGTTNKLVWWVIGIFGTISTGVLMALINIVMGA